MGSFAHRRSTLSRRVFGAALLAGLSLIASAATAVNETPKKRNAIIFGPHPSAQDIDESVELWLCAENYDVSKYVWGRGEGDPTIANLKSIAAAGFAVLVIVAHGGTDAITLEDYAVMDSARAHYNRYRSDPAYQDIKNDLEYGTVPEADPSGGGSGERYYVGLKTAGLRKLFGGADANRSIVCAITCHSWELQTGSNPKPFGATEFLGWDGTLDNKLRRRASRGFVIMGGPEGIPSRPVKPAFAGKMKHDGPGNTTLAPACTDHTPVNDVVLPLNVKTDGSTTYETKMRTSDAAIMEPSGCNAVITDEVWTNETLHRFKVEPKKKGRLVLKVKPKVAVSQNNDNWLIGNLYDPTEDYETPRPENNECQFGQSGLDGLRPCVPPENPYRWCVWCQEKPIDPPGSPKPPKAMGTSSAPRRVAAGEQDAFVLYQDAPEAGTAFLHSPLPANLFFTQVGDWYGHVLFFPDASQIGQQFDVQFQTVDENGPRSEQGITWQVEPRMNQLALFAAEDTLPAGDLGVVVARPDDPVDHKLILLNSGNTAIDNITMSSFGLPGLVTFQPSFIARLEVGASVAVVLHMEGGAPPSTYVGSITASGGNADGPLAATAAISVRVNNPPVIGAPGGVLVADVGIPISVPISFFDADGDAVTAYLEVAAFDASLELLGAPDDVETTGGTFSWTPPAEVAGLEQRFPIVADDGGEPSVQEIRIQVNGTTGAGERLASVTFTAGPTPARGAVRFAVGTPDQAAVTIDVYDAAGRRVARPVERELADAAGRTWTWKPVALDRGVYFVHATIGDREEIRRLVWLGEGDR